MNFLDLCAQVVFKRPRTDDFTAERFPTFREQRANTNQIAESFFWNQTADCNDQRRSRRKIGSTKFREVESVVNAMDAISPMRESFAQKACGEIRFGDDCARFIHNFIQSDFELPRRENVVRVRGKTESDRKKLVDPKSSARSHAGEMRVDVIDPHCPQEQTNVDRLVEPKEIGAATPFIQSGDNVCADLPFFCGASNFFQQFFFVRKIMHTFDDTRVPILGWFVFWVPD